MFLSGGSRKPHFLAFSSSQRVPSFPGFWVPSSKPATLHLSNSYSIIIDPSDHNNEGSLSLKTVLCDQMETKHLISTQTFPTPAFPLPSLTILELTGSSFSFICFILHVRKSCLYLKYIQPALNNPVCVGGGEKEREKSI